MPDYATIRALHLTCAALSIGGFVLRFGLMLRGSPLLAGRAARVLPHEIDTLLLASALVMVWKGGGMPGRDAWLNAKIAGLLLYIVLGTVALKRGRTQTQRVVAGLLAILVFAFIVSAAVLRSPLGFLAPVAG